MRMLLTIIHTMLFGWYTPPLFDAIGGDVVATTFTNTYCQLPGKNQG